MSNKAKSFVAIAVSGLLASCIHTNNPQSSDHTILNSITHFNSVYCTSGAHNELLDLSKITLNRELNIPLMYQGYNNIEGPVWFDGALYYSNMGSRFNEKNGSELTHQGTIWRWVPGESPAIWLEDKLAGTNGLALDHKGRLIVGRQLDGSISTIDWENKKVTPIISKFNGKRFNSPNDLVVSYDGTIYFTDPNWNTPSNISPKDIQGGGIAGSLDLGQRIYRVTTDGVVTSTLATELVPALRDKPNGIMLSLEQDQIIIGGLQGLWVFDLNSGELSNPKRLLNSPIDGLGKDCSGNIYVTTTRAIPLRNDGQVIVVLNKQYQEIGEIHVPNVQIVTNVAFGGEDGKTLFVTSLTAPMVGDKPRKCGDKLCLSASIYTAKLNVQGFPY